jgi:phenylpropionate dioxygenase-like ring-hydroxylating dioxygenase large terminal subunit
MDFAIKTPPVQRTIPTIETLSSEAQAAIRRIPSHDQAPNVALDVSRPSSIFLDEARYAQEQASIFRALPVPITVSAHVAEPGSVVAMNSYGLPLLVTRDKSGMAHVFLNACGHKSAKLIEDDQVHQTSRMSCPYHAWTYALDGKLIGVARPETFENLCKEERRLAELPSREAGGLIWAGLDRTRDYDFATIDDQLVDDFEGLNIPRLHLYGHKQFEVAANWKLVLEPFLEGYHVQRLHAASVGPLFADVPNVVDVLGTHIRQISGKAGFTQDSLKIPDENIHKTVTHAYQVFPNAVVITSPYYLSIMIIAPRAVGRTTVEYFMLTREQADNPKAEALFSKSYEMVLHVFGNEDFRAATICHEGLASGAFPTTIYSGMEATVPLYYGLLEARLENA